jgi:hypothetical protein
MSGFLMRTIGPAEPLTEDQENEVRQRGLRLLEMSQPIPANAEPEHAEDKSKKKKKKAKKVDDEVDPPKKKKGDEEIEPPKKKKGKKGEEEFESPKKPEDEGDAPKAGDEEVELPKKKGRRSSEAGQAPAKKEEDAPPLKRKISMKSASEVVEPPAKPEKRKKVVRLADPGD